MSSYSIVPTCLRRPFYSWLEPNELRAPIFAPHATMAPISRASAGGRYSGVCGANAALSPNNAATTSPACVRRALPPSSMARLSWTRTFACRAARPLIDKAQSGAQRRRDVRPGAKDTCGSTWVVRAPSCSSDGSVAAAVATVVTGLATPQKKPESAFSLAESGFEFRCTDFITSVHRFFSWCRCCSSAVLSAHAAQRTSTFAVAAPKRTM